MGYFYRQKLGEGFLGRKKQNKTKQNSISKGVEVEWCRVHSWKCVIGSVRLTCHQAVKFLSLCFLNVVCDRNQRDT